jgi:hypothetical protein
LYLKYSNYNCLLILLESLFKSLCTLCESVCVCVFFHLFYLVCLCLYSPWASLPWLPLHTCLCVQVSFDVHPFLWKQWCHCVGRCLGKAKWKIIGYWFLLVIKCIIKVIFDLRSYIFVFVLTLIIQLHFSLFIDLLQ